MFQFIRQWLRPKPLLLVLVPAALCAVIVVGLTQPVRHDASAVATPSQSSRTNPVKATQSPTSRVPAPRTTKSTSHPPIRPIKRPRLAKRAQPVIRLYASFPNRAGADALIKQLRPLVGTSVIQDLQKRWSGPPVTTVYMKVQKITPAGQYRLASGKVEVDAVVTRQAVHDRTPASTHLMGVAVTFEKRASHWVIIDVANKQGDI